MAQRRIRPGQCLIEQLPTKGLFTIMKKEALTTMRFNVAKYFEIPLHKSIVYNEELNRFYAIFRTNIGILNVFS